MSTDETEQGVLLAFIPMQSSLRRNSFPPNYLRPKTTQTRYHSFLLMLILWGTFFFWRMSSMQFPAGKSHFFSEWRDPMPCRDNTRTLKLKKHLFEIGSKLRRTENSIPVFLILLFSDLRSINQKTIEVSQQCLQINWKLQNSTNPYHLFLKI